MSRSKISLISLILTALLILPTLASCNGGNGENVDSNTEKTSTTESSNIKEPNSAIESVSASESQADSENTESEKTDSENTTEGNTEANTKPEIESKTETEIITAPALEGEYADIIENANNNTRSILDFLTQDKISTLQAENQALRLTASQQAQNAFLIDQLGTKAPVPAYVVANPYATTYAPANYYTTGCGCN
jgi:hypothetical protein